MTDIRIFSCVLILLYPSPLPLNYSTWTARIYPSTPLLHGGQSCTVQSYPRAYFSFCTQWFFCPPGLKFFSDYFDYTLTSVATSRFFLSLRRSISHYVTRTENPDLSTCPEEPYPLTYNTGRTHEFDSRVLPDAILEGSKLYTTASFAEPKV